jgi:predicted nuclease of predicted toxin-antitoxin system
MIVNLLLDANISWRSVAVLKNHFDDCFHVDKVGLQIPATDAQIWEYAKANNLLIVSNDEDFLNLSVTKGFPPKVILLKTGNQSKQVVEELLIKSKEQIQKLHSSEDLGVLEIIK